MDFNKYRVSIIARLGLFALTLLLLYELAYKDAFFLTVALVFVLAIVQVMALFRYIERNQSDIEDFFQSVKEKGADAIYEDCDPYSYKAYLIDQFSELVQKLQRPRHAYDERQQYLTTIVQHVGIGLVTFDNDGNIQIMNIAAKKLLKVEQMRHISQLGQISDELVDTFRKLKTGGRALVKISINDEEKQLSVYAIELLLGGKNYKLVSLQNIQSELEENEMEAWQKLVRVLTHEIMNSVTPISSLATTVEAELLGHMEKGTGACELNREEMEDIHLAVKTIQRRSEGLIRFVSDFRSLTHTPEPKFQLVAVQELFDQVQVLFKKDMSEGGVVFNLSVTPSNLAINMDPQLIQQVLINLIKNALQALDGKENKRIELVAFQDEKNHVQITLKDNGRGIDEDALPKIFIPFFTTKKTGSGIGLSLSRQIMRRHNGSISVRSKINEGTEFTLRF